MDYPTPDIVTCRSCGQLMWCHPDVPNNLCFECGHKRRIDELENEVERLRAIVDKLPKTADGVSIVPGMILYLTWTPEVDGQRCQTRHCSGQIPVDILDEVILKWKMSGGTPASQLIDTISCFSIRQAADAAGGKDES